MDRGKRQAQRYLNEIRRAAKKKIIYTEHALNEMHAEEEMITKDKVRQVIFEGEIIEDYPMDIRGHSCLMLAFTEKIRPVHVVCAPKGDYLGIITAYVPTDEKWEADFKTRKRKEGEK